MKRILAILFATIFAGQVWAQKNFDFSAECSSGQTLYYKITSDSTVVIMRPSNNWDNSYEGYTEPSGSLAIPKIVNNNGVTYSVTGINGYAFNGCDDLTSVTIPNSVTIIGGGAFRNCVNLKKVEYASIESLCSIDFVDYDSNPLRFAHHLYINGLEITELTIPNTITSIGAWVFYGCSSLQSVIIPNSVKCIGYNAFCGCSSLVSITIPNSVTSIEGEAFYGCKSLTSITIPNSVTSIEEFAFSGCINLTSITIPNSITSVGQLFDWPNNLQYNEFDNAIYLGNSENPYVVLLTAKSDDITECVVNDNCKVIARDAFASCNNIKSITIPSTIVGVGNTYEKHDLLSLEILQYNEYGNALYLGNAENPYVVLIGPNENMNACEINNECKVIAEDAFKDFSDLTSVTIPNSVKNIGRYAFSGCDNLTIYCEASSKPFGWVDKWNKDEYGDSERPVVWGYKSNSGNQSEENQGNEEENQVNDNNTEENQGSENNNSSTQNTPKPQPTTPEGIIVHHILDIIHNVISIVTDVDEDAVNQVNIYACDNKIVVENVETANAEISVFDINGRVVAKTTANSSRVEIPMRAQGVYIVRVGSNAKRVVVN
ncbi:MAG: leucine-rich repeat domain-containing protein [Salinivirgaceae bacterium]|nr:leucine-rich repeat domain-containing protein [Salinivirgaceae bacterium]